MDYSESFPKHRGDSDDFGASDRQRDGTTLPIKYWFFNTKLNEFEGLRRSVGLWKFYEKFFNLVFRLNNYLIELFSFYSTELVA